MSFKISDFENRRCTLEMAQGLHKSLNRDNTDPSAQSSHCYVCLVGKSRMACEEQTPLEDLFDMLE